MKLNSELILREIAGENMIINPAEVGNETSGIYSLNETAAYLWKELSEYSEFTLEEAVRILQKEYEVEEAVALKDVRELLNTWEKIGILQAE